MLATFVSKGVYHFTTYDAKTSNTNMFQNIDYSDQLEGRWNFIYFSY